MYRLGVLLIGFLFLSTVGEEVWFPHSYQVRQTKIVFRVPGLAKSRGITKDSVYLHAFGLSRRGYFYELRIYDFAKEGYDFQTDGFLEIYQAFREQVLLSKHVRLLEEQSELYKGYLCKTLSLERIEAGQFVREDKRYLFIGALVIEQTVSSEDTKKSRYDFKKNRYFSHLKITETTKK